MWLTKRRKGIKRGLPLWLIARMPNPTQADFSIRVYNLHLVVKTFRFGSSVGKDQHINWTCGCEYDSVALVDWFQYRIDWHLLLTLQSGVVFEKEAGNF